MKSEDLTMVSNWKAAKTMAVKRQHWMGHMTASQISVYTNRKQCYFKDFLKSSEFIKQLSPCGQKPKEKEKRCVVKHYWKLKMFWTISLKLAVVIKKMLNNTLSKLCFLQVTLWKDRQTVYVPPHSYGNTMRSVLRHAYILCKIIIILTP